MEEKFSHMIPLMAFTAAAIVAAGIAGAGAVVVYVDATWPDLLTALWWGFALAAAGSAVSLFHLGRVGRAWMAFRGLSHSWLSREAAAVGLFALGIGASALAVTFEVAWSAVVIIAAAVIGLVVALVIGNIYILPGQTGWAGCGHAFGPAVSALYFGAAVLVGCVGLSWSVWIFWPLLAADALLSVARMLRFLNSEGRGIPFTFPELEKAAQAAHFLRLLTGTAIPAGCLFLAPSAAPYFIVAAIALDRFAFYAGTAQSSPKAEVARIKAERMAAASREGRDEVNIDVEL